jgi:hypothetical protein
LELFLYEWHKQFGKPRVWQTFALLMLLVLLALSWQCKSQGYSDDPITQEQYDSYRQSLISNAEKLTTVSIFASRDSFSYRNAKKIIEEYTRCEDIVVTPESPKGIQVFCDSTAGDVLLVIWMLLLINWVILDEYRSGQFSLQRTTRYGRKQLGMVKLLVLILMTLFGVLVFELERFLLVGLFAGQGTLSRSIQSVFPESIRHMRVGSVLLYGLMIKCVVSVCLICMLYFLSQLLLDGRTFIWVVTLLLLGGFLAYLFIPENSWISLLREINFWGFLNGTRVIYRFKSLNLFEQPVPYEYVMAAVLGLTAVVVIVPSLFLYGRRNGNRNQNLFGMRRLPVSHTGLFRHEGYKLMTMGGWWLVLIAIAAGMFYTAEDYYVYTTQAEYYEVQYCRLLQGTWGAEQEEMLLNEQERFSGIADGTQFVESISQMELYNAYLLIRDRAERIREVEKGQLLYEKGYNLLLVHQNPQGFLKQSVMILLLLLFSMGTVWMFEYKYEQIPLIRATKMGLKNIAKWKRIWCLFMGAVIYAGAWSVLFVRVIKTFGLRAFSAPAASLEALSRVPGWISIGGWICMQQLIILIFVEAAALLLLRLMTWLFGGRMHE